MRHGADACVRARRRFEGSRRSVSRLVSTNTTVEESVVSSRSEGRSRGYFSVDVQFKTTLYGGALVPAPSGTGIKKRWPSGETSRNTTLRGTLNNAAGGPATRKVDWVSTATDMTVPSGAR